MRNCHFWIVSVLLAACDPVNDIPVRFAVHPVAQVQPSMVSAYWVQTYEGRTYVANRIFRREVVGGEIATTEQECCGTAAAYRSGELRFWACIATPGSDPMLVCGKPGAPEAELVRTTAPGTTCDAIEKTVGRLALDVRTCTLFADK